MLYVQLDTNWPDNPKLIRAGFDGAGLHATTLCLAKRGDKDGWVDRIVLEHRYHATDELIERLIDLRLLETNGERVRPWGWHQINLSSDAIARKKAESARRASHSRWHSGTYDDCERCSSATDADAIRDGMQADAEVCLEVETEQQHASDARTSDERQQRIDAAALAVAKERHAGRYDIGAGYIPAAARGIAKDHHQELHTHLTANPSASVDDLVALINGVGTRTGGAIVDDDLGIFLPGSGWCAKVGASAACPPAAHGGVA